MEGYDFEIVGDALHDYKCPFCLLLLRQALLMPCSHSACKECLLKWEQQADTGDFRCPSCNRIYEREKVHAGEEGKFIDRLITTSLKVKCKQHLKNCNWVGTISNYKIHEKRCTQQPVACQFPGCDLTVVRKDLPRHQKICGYRIVACEYCTKMIQFNQLEQHYGICDYCDVTCQQGCGKSFKRKDKPTHTAQECPNTEISCPYQKMSCKQKIMRKDLADHMNNFAHQHSILLSQHTLQLSNEVRDLKETNEVLQEHKESSSMRISHLERKLEEKEKEIHALNYELVDIKNQMKQGCQKNSEDLKTILEKISILDTKLQVNERKHNKDILLTKNKREEFKEIDVAISQLSNEDRSKNCSFDADVVCDVTETDIPDHLEKKFQEEKRIEAQRRRERSEAHLYMDVQVVTADGFCSWSGNDLFNLEHFKPFSFKIQKKEKLRDATRIIAEAFGYTASQCRLWIFQMRANNTTRPAYIDVRNDDKIHCENPGDIDIFYANDNEAVMLAFLETVNVENGESSLPDFDNKEEVNLFFKYYDPRTKIMSYCGNAYVNLKSQPSTLFPILCERAGLPKNTKLLFYEEIKAGQTKQIRTDKKFYEVVTDLMDGDIICFQAYDPDFASYEVPSPIEYFKVLRHRIHVLLCDKNNLNDSGFVETLNLKMTYSQIAKSVAASLDADPRKIQFFKSQVYRGQPGHPIKCTFDGQLKDIVATARRGRKKLYYQMLTMPVDELENKIQFKCTFINAELKDERELVIPVEKQGHVKDLLEETSDLVPTIDTHKLRLVELSSYKIHRIIPSHTSLDILVQQTPKSYRIEEIPKEHLIIDKKSVLVPVMHFQKELFTAFGTPFYVKITEGETISSIQERVRQKLGIPEKEFDKIKFCVVCMGKLSYFPEDPNQEMSLSHFTSTSSQPNWLGLDHVNKAPKRTRYAYTEKAIKIHN